MGTAAAILTGIFIILISLGYLGVAMPGIVLGIVGLLAGVLIIASGLPWAVKQ